MYKVVKGRCTEIKEESLLSRGTKEHSPHPNDLKGLPILGKLPRL